MTTLSVGGSVPAAQISRASTSSPTVLTQLGAPLNHYFLEMLQGYGLGCWVDRFSSADLDPSCVGLIDGDTADLRRVALGCEDGYVRVMDEIATDDDGHAIFASVLMGPLVPRSATERVRLERPEIQFDRTQSGATVRLYASPNADDPGLSVASETVTASVNAALSIGANGNALFLELMNDQAAQAFGVEHVNVTLIPVGR